MNHTTGIDALVAVAHLNGNICFLVGDHIRHVPFINYLVTASGGLFAPRGGTITAREAIVKQIKTYQTEYQENQPQLVIFPEGATSNNEYLLPFKRGAFSSHSPVLPIVLRY
jgi:1-acyl-sn-glycerol-3-phosphate acyltransferase